MENRSVASPAVASPVVSSSRPRTWLGRFGLLVAAVGVSKVLGPRYEGLEELTVLVATNYYILPIYYRYIYDNGLRYVANVAAFMLAVREEGVKARVMQRLAVQVPAGYEWKLATQQDGERMVIVCLPETA